MVLLIGLLLKATPTSGQGQWETVEGTNRPEPRAEDAFVRAGNRFFLLGSRGIKPVSIYDPESRTWSEGAPVPIAISHCQAVSYQGLIYLMGGLVGDWPSETPMTHIFIYNPLTDTWIVGPEIPPHRQRGSAGTVVYNDKIYMVCGIVNGHTSGWVPWLDQYDPATNQWKELPDAPHARDHLQAAVVDGQLVVAGGRRSGYMGQGLEATVAETDIYDFQSGRWHTLDSPSGDIPTERAGYAAIAVGDEVLVMGGESGSQVPAHSEVEALNITTGTWRTLSPLNQGRHGTGVLASRGQLYIAAGCGQRGGSPELDSFERYVIPDLERREDVPVVAGTLEISEPEIHLSDVPGQAGEKKLVTLRNTGGNQGIPIVYMILAPGGEFNLEFPYSLPYVLAPGKAVSFKLGYSPPGGAHQEATLLIKVMDRGKMQPLELKLSGN